MFHSLIVVSLLCLFAPGPDEPPRPDPKKPVDYARWFNYQHVRVLLANAMTQHEEAFAQYTDDPQARQLATDVDAAQWNAEQRAQIDRWLAKNKPVLDLVKTACAERSCYFLRPMEPPDLLPAKLTWVPAFRHVATALAARARMQLLANNVGGTMDDVVTLLRVAAHVGTQPSREEYVAGLDIMALTYGVLLDIPRLAKTPPKYADVVGRLNEADHTPRDIGRNLDFERLRLLDAAQRYLRDADADGRYESAELPTNLGLPESKVKLDPPPDLDEVIKEIDAYLAGWRTVADDLAPARAHGDKLRQKTGAPKSLVAALAVDWSAPILQRRTVMALQRAARTVLHLHAHHAAHGEWPKDLKEALIAELPTAGEDPVSGQSFVYRVPDGQPRLYSIGLNGKDDGGEVYREGGVPAWGPEGDFVFWPRVTAGE